MNDIPFNSARNQVKNNYNFDDGALFLFQTLTDFFFYQTLTTEHYFFISNVDRLFLKIKYMKEKSCVFFFYKSPRPSRSSPSSYSSSSESPPLMLHLFFGHFRLHDGLGFLGHFSGHLGLQQNHPLIIAGNSVHVFFFFTVNKNQRDTVIKIKKKQLEWFSIKIKCIYNEPLIFSIKLQPLGFFGFGFGHLFAFLALLRSISLKMQIMCMEWVTANCRVHNTTITRTGKLNEHSILSSASWTNLGIKSHILLLFFVISFTISSFLFKLYKFFFSNR